MSLKLFILTLILFPATTFVFAQVADKTYEKFDFVQGNKVLFEDNFLEESLNEIPSYWEVGQGRAEVSKIGTDMCLGLLNNARVSPRKKGSYSVQDKLTFEFDYLFRGNSSSWKKVLQDGWGGQLDIQFVSEKEWQNDGGSEMTEKLGDFMQSIVIKSEGVVTFNGFTGTYSAGEKDSDVDLPADLIDKWVHVSIAINKRSLKVYLNAQRVLNAQISAGDIYTFQINADQVSEGEDGYQSYIKNVRIAEGGADPYKLLTSNGKYIARGITFDVGKSTIRPESFGELNGIATLMKNDATLKFEIGGHTDSDGEESANIKLSQERADAVKKKLTELGVEASRLTTKGYGEGKPFNDNSSPENKANNRRVEFVKI
ncbi:MAG: OmpA family protein [Cryomorphaceae bacterium]|nr:OmpA family protein [Cryomorphaceae bacterium]